MGENKPMSTIEYLWRVSQQLIVAKDKEMKQICGFGSGFFIYHKDNLFFVTADHVLHGEDFEKGERISKEDKLFVANNVKGEGLTSAYTPLGEFYFFDKYNFEEIIKGKDVDIEAFAIPDMQDYTFCLRKNKFECPFLTHALLDYDGAVIVPDKLEKIIISSEAIIEPKDDDYYIVAGCVKYKIVDGIRIDRFNAVHLDLRYSRTENNYIILQSPENVEYEYWAGLSGSPILNHQGLLLGVIIRIREITNEIVVVPIKEILGKMNYALKCVENK